MRLTQVVLRSGQFYETFGKIMKKPPLNNEGNVGDSVKVMLQKELLVFPKERMLLLNQDYPFNGF